MHSDFAAGLRHDGRFGRLFAFGCTGHRFEPLRPSLVAQWIFYTDGGGCVAGDYVQDYRLNTVYWTLYVELMGSIFFIPLYWLTSATPAAGRGVILIGLLVLSYVWRDGGLFPQYFFCFELGILAYQLQDFVASSQSRLATYVSCGPCWRASVS